MDFCLLLKICKYSQKLLTMLNNLRQIHLKSNSKRAIQKITETKDDLIGKKITKSLENFTTE